MGFNSGFKGLIRHYSHSKSECLYVRRIRRPNCPKNALGTLKYRCLFSSKAEPSRLSNFGLEFANDSSHPDGRIVNFAHKGAFRCDWLPLTSTDPELSGRTCRILRMNFSRDKRHLWPNFLCSDLVWISPPQKLLKDCNFQFSAKF